MIHDAAAVKAIQEKQFSLLLGAARCASEGKAENHSRLFAGAVATLSDLLDFIVKAEKKP